MTKVKATLRRQNTAAKQANDMSNAKRRAALLAMLIVVAAVLVNLNTEAAVRFFWKMRYGDHLRWAGIDVGLDGSEYFMPPAKSGQYLIIRDAGSTALISLHMADIAPDKLRLIANSDCAITKCSDFKEQLSTVDRVKIVSYDYVWRSSGAPQLQRHVVVEGSGVRMEYLGPAAEYRKHHPTMDRIARALAAKVLADGGPQMRGI